MTPETLDKVINWLRAADHAIAAGQPERARLLATLARATMTRAGLRYADARTAAQIDRMIGEGIAKGG